MPAQQHSARFHNPAFLSESCVPNVIQGEHVGRPKIDLGTAAPFFVFVSAVPFKRNLNFWQPFGK